MVSEPGSWFREFPGFSVFFDFPFPGFFLVSRQPNVNNVLQNNRFSYFASGIARTVIVLLDDVRVFSQPLLSVASNPGVKGHCFTFQFARFT